MTNLAKDVKKTLKHMIEREMKRRYLTEKSDPVLLQKVLDDVAELFNAAMEEVLPPVILTFDGKTTLIDFVRGPDGEPLKPKSS